MTASIIQLRSRRRRVRARPAVERTVRFGVECRVAMPAQASVPLFIPGIFFWGGSESPKTYNAAKLCALDLFQPGKRITIIPRKLS